MRFDDFVAMREIAVLPVDEFAGVQVHVQLPPGWETFDAAPGVGVWVCRSDPRADEFCANAVLTMHRVQAPLDCGEVFTMLVNQQLQQVTGCTERHRDISAAAEGAGVVGTLDMEIAHEFGPIDSVCRSRIVAVEEEVLIVQLTTSALRDSPVVREPTRLLVRTSMTADDD